MLLPLLAAAMLLPLPEACREARIPAGPRAKAGFSQDAFSAPPPRRLRRTRTRTSNAAAARCLRLRLIERREALLHDFLVRADTEAPQFSDPRSYRIDRDVAVGPTVVTRDFVGSPIIRARVTNLTGADVSFLLSATLESPRGEHSGASAVVFLRAGETRTVELLCPDQLAPRALTWSTMPL
jgi:hypothetical protein